MKILAFVDTHGSKRAFDEILKRARQADILVCAGDLTMWGESTEKWIKFLEKAGKPMVIVPGNHESEREISEICKKYKYCIYLHRAAYEYGEYMFFGFGGGGFSEGNADFERIGKHVEKDAKGKRLILITHGPPYGTALDSLPGSGHRGCRSIRRFIEEVKPMIAISGHLHETAGNTDLIGKTFVINPGSFGALLKI
ncbi:MAG: metallophosphoesterase family protein [Nanoarchaeota archaeon]|nr:metallophosphoesterase family protein [Nanoarchaeota archaeon]